MPDEDAGGESLFEQLMAEAVTPLHLELGDGDDTAGWTIQAVDSDGVIDLDDLHSPLDIIDALVGEDLADEVLDALEDLPWDDTLDTADQLREHFALVQLPAGMWAFLVEQIDLYGEELESDLAEQRSADLLDWFRGRRPWPQLHRFLRRMPEGSRYHAAVLDDEELARRRIEYEQQNPSDDDESEDDRRPPLVGETQGLALQRSGVSALLRIEHAIYASQAPKNKRGSPPKPLKGPLTARDRLLDELGTAEVYDIFDQVTPGWRGDEPPPSGFRESDSGLLVPDN